MVKPETIHDAFGDGFLGCPKCKEPVHFPLVRNPDLIYKYRPKKCSKCSEEFDWEGVNKSERKEIIYM